jgi:hypothetical protein
MPMKVYNLSCEHDHRFEGWFSSEADFCAQAEKGLIECPTCGSCSVVRMPSAPRLNLSSAQEPQSADLHEKIQAHILSLVREVVANSEDVGERFAEEARKIHYREAPERAIRGVATASECESLVEEGIDVTPLPLPDALKETLH